MPRRLRGSGSAANTPCNVTREASAKHARRSSIDKTSRLAGITMDCRGTHAPRYGGADSRTPIIATGERVSLFGYLSTIFRPCSHLTQLPPMELLDVTRRRPFLGGVHDPPYFDDLSVLIDIVDDSIRVARHHSLTRLGNFAGFPHEAK